MRATSFALLFVSAVAWPSQTHAADVDRLPADRTVTEVLDRVDRRIRSEPGYQSSPRYVLLAFGSESPNFVWLVEDGRTLHVDRNANGDLTDDGPPVEPSDERQLGRRGWDYDYAVGDLEFANGEVHTDLKVMRWNYERHPDGTGLSVTVNRVTPMYAGWSPLWSDSPAAARVIHFGGTLEPVKLRGAAIALKPGRQGLSIAFINRGVGERAHSRLSIKSVPQSVVPLAEITWPVVDGEPVTTTHPLTERCCYWEFYTDELEVPDSVAEGTATVSLSLPGYVNPFGFKTRELEIPVRVNTED